MAGCHIVSRYIWIPVVPGTTRHYAVLPGITDKVISEQSPGYLAISGMGITILSHCIDRYVSRQVLNMPRTTI
eukprot:1346350-Amorphochlora_amoeboformis.AAC.1